MEHFITVNVRRRNEEPLMMMLRIIVVPHHNHFIMKRILSPKPLIVYTTPSLLEAYPGEDTNHKIFSLVMSSMKPRLYQAELLKLLQPSNQIPLLDNVEAEVYSFIDPLKTCIVVLESEEAAYLRNNKWRWLHPNMRRKEFLPPEGEHEYTFDYEEATVGKLIWEERELERRTRIREEPSDVVYHSSGEYFRPSLSQSLLMPPSFDADINSSKSSGDSSDQAQGILSMSSSQWQRMFRKALIDESLTNIHDEGEVHVTHLSESNYQRRKAEFQLPVVVIHEQERGKNLKQSSPSTATVPKFLMREANEDTRKKPVSTIASLFPGISGNT
jgi:hypothetical protein